MPWVWAPRGGKALSRPGPVILIQLVAVLGRGGRGLVERGDVQAALGCPEWA